MVADGREVAWIGQGYERQHSVTRIDVMVLVDFALALKEPGKG